MTVSGKAHLRRCAAFFVTATYGRTSHSSGFAQPASGPFLRLSVLVPGLAFLALLFFASSVAALEPGVRFGYGQGRSAEEAVPSVGLFLGIDLPGPVNLELSGDFWREEGEAGRIEVDSLPLQATVLLYPLPSILVRPYLVGGGGLFFVRIREQSAFGSFPEEKSLLPSLHGGGGLEIPLAGLASLRAEGRYTFVRETAALVAGEKYDLGGWRLYGALSLTF